MKKIDRHICKIFMKFFLLSAFAFINIFVLSQIFKIIKYVTEGKMTGFESIEFILVSIPKMLIDIMPLAVLLGGLIAMNVMATNLEIMSLKTSGISFKRIIRYPVIICAVVSIGIFYISARVAPKSYLRVRELRNDDNKTEIPTIKERAFLRGNGSYVYYAKKIDRINKKASDIEIIDMNAEFNQIERVIIAKSAVYDENSKNWILKEVAVNNILEKKSVQYKEFRDPKYTEEPDRFITVNKDARTLTIAELKKEMKNLRAVGSDIKEYTHELAKRYSYPFASFFVCFIGLALGSRYVRGASAMSVGITVIYGYGYYLLNGVFEALSNNGFINPFIAGWIPNLLYLGLGIYFVQGSEH